MAVLFFNLHLDEALSWFPCMTRPSWTSRKSKKMSVYQWWMDQCTRTASACPLPYHNCPQFTATPFCSQLRFRPCQISWKLPKNISALPHESWSRVQASHSPSDPEEFLMFLKINHAVWAWSSRLSPDGICSSTWFPQLKRKTLRPQEMRTH